MQGSLQNADWEDYKNNGKYYKLRNDAPSDGSVLVRRIDADFPALVDALWALGYYDAEVSITVAGVPVATGAA